MAAKKTFTDTVNPALQFITPTTDAPATPSKPPRAKRQPSKASSTNKAPKVKANAAPEGYKVNPAFVETKSRRLQLLMQPSLHDRIKARAAAEGLSVNEYIHKALEEALGED